jgi:hypothetical protein
METINLTSYNSTGRFAGEGPKIRKAFEEQLNSLYKNQYFNYVLDYKNRNIKIKLTWYHRSRNTKKDLH